jgi:hypothetical protein
LQLSAILFVWVGDGADPLVDVALALAVAVVLVGSLLVSVLVSLSVVVET